MTRNVRTAITIGIPTVVLVLLVTAALLASRRDSVTYADGSPEAVAQSYFEALIDHDAGGAYELFTPALQSRCPRPPSAEVDYLAITRVVLDEVTTSGGTATVRVSVTQDLDSGPFGSGEVTNTETLRLEKIDGRWLIGDLPWPFFSCFGKGG
ncbi:MAG: hypothetical protein R2761_26845 [Acidimicrobiales bacterium]